MNLHYATNTISVAVAITLEEAQQAYTLTKVSFADAEQTKAPYLAVNPKGRVPALEAGGTVLTETGALLDFIAALAPEADLIPSDPLQAAKMRSVMYYLASTMHINHAHKMRGSRWADLPESHADMAAKVTQTMTTSAEYLEAECLHGPFILGEQFTIGDAYLFIVCSWLEGDGVDVANFPKITTFMAAMNARASVQKMRDTKVLV
ncbi:MAG: glutathione S-transferase family protein [Aliishimia sp.]